MMSTLRIEHEQSFRVVRLANQHVEVAVVPELGAKLLSLRLLSSAREWLWRPPGPLRLFRNKLGDDFAGSTLIGADECVPTITACQVGGRELPDHGEAWSASWELDSGVADAGMIRTRLRLPCSPLTLTRSVTLSGCTAVLDYELVNLDDKPQPFLWALHPLLSFVEGDQLRLPEEVQTVRIEAAHNPHAPRGSAWEWPAPMPGVNLAGLQLGGDDSFAKFFAGPLQRGWACIENPRTGDRLACHWPIATNPFLGVWLTRGGWRGFHHPAIEPTNAPCDSLAEALASPRPELIVPAAGTRRWQVTLDLTPASLSIA